MQLSLHSDYALRILMTLATSAERLSVDEIARRFAISRNHLAKVAHHLQAAGLVETFRGRGGGMQLSRGPEQISVGEVVREFEMLDGFVACFSSGAGCAVNGLCGLKPALAEALEDFLARLDQYRISDLVPDRQAFAARLELPQASAPS